MKMNKSIITAAVAAIALSMTAYAEGGDKKPGKKGKGEGPSAEQREAMKAKMLERFDTDKDGNLSEEEKKAAHEVIKKEREEIRAAVTKQFDKDGDGKLSKDEREGVREWVKANYPNAIHLRHGKHGKKGGKGPKGKQRKAPAGA